MSRLLSDVMELLVKGLEDTQHMCGTLWKGDDVVAKILPFIPLAKAVSCAVAALPSHECSIDLSGDLKVYGTCDAIRLVADMKAALEK